MHTAPPFRDRLVAHESMTASLRERYEREMDMMLEKRLTAPRRWGIAALIVLLLAQATFFIYAIVTFSDLPVLAKTGFGVGVLFTLSFVALLTHVLRRGSVNIKTHPSAITNIMWVFLVIMITLFMLLAGQLSDPAKGMSIVLNGLVFVVFGVVFYLANLINQAQIRTQEKLLEIELRIAELREVTESKVGA
jgi:choline-glycine betaine transporter